MDELEYLIAGTEQVDALLGKRHKECGTLGSSFVDQEALGIEDAHVVAALQVRELYAVLAICVLIAVPSALAVKYYRVVK